MSEVIRYSQCANDLGLVDEIEAVDGEWVKYSEYVKLQAQLAEKDKEINRLLGDKQALQIAATINHERRQG